MKTVVGLFESPEEARRAVEALRGAGIRPEEVSLVVRDRREAVEPGVEPDEGAVVGALGGGVLGGLLGLAAGLAAMTVPGIGPVLAAGPIAATIAGGALGAATGGLLGSLMDEGIPEQEARDYQAGVERGGILLAVSVRDDREAEVREILKRQGLRNLSEHRALWERNPDYRYDADQEERSLPGHGDPLKTAEVEGALAAGGATGAVVGGVIGGLTGGPAGAAVGVAAGAAVGAATGAALDYAAVEPEFHEEWRNGPYRDRSTWDDASAAYRYGWESYSEPEFRGRPWREVRADVERRWPGGSAWPDYEPMVHSAWERRARQGTETAPPPG
jgi:uncharacterized membrane protein